MSGLLFKLLMGKGGGAYAGITPVFNASVTTGVAPLGVVFDGTDTTASNTVKPWRDLLYGFDSGDTASGNYSYGTRVGQSKRKTLGGSTGGHVYETPGTYTATMSVFDGLGFTTRTQTIVVQDPDVVFSGTNTICCSISGVFTGAPSGSSNQTVANLAAALAFLASGKRVLLRSGDAWTASASFSLTGTKDNMVLGSFGGGRAVVTLSASINFLLLSSGSCSRLQVRDLEVNGASYAAGRVALGGLGLTFTGLHFHNVYTYDISSLFTAHGTNFTKNFTVSSCEVQRIVGGAGSVGIFSATESLLLTDTLVNDTTAGEHCLRFPYINKGFINGVSASNPAANKHALAIRCPTWAGGAVNGLAANSYTQYCIVSDSDLSSNTAQIACIQPQGGALDERARRVIFERNYFHALGNLSQQGLLFTSFECMSRNNVFNMTGASAYVAAISVGGSTALTPDSNESWNDTLYASDSHTQALGLTGATGTSSNTYLRNFLQYTPLCGSSSVISSTMVPQSVGTNNTSDANSKALNPLFNGTLTAIEGFALGSSSPYATSAALETNYSDALDKIRVSNGGAMMLASNATSAWTLLGQ